MGPSSLIRQRAVSLAHLAERRPGCAAPTWRDEDHVDLATERSFDHDRGLCCAAGAMPLSRSATEGAYRRHRAIHDAADWPRLADLFAPDATYEDPFFGKTEGREAIRDFLVRSMTGLEDWSFPIAWTVIDAGRVVTRFKNRLPGRRRDGGYFEFTGTSAIDYGDDGQIINQTDSYDRSEALRVIAESKLPAVELAVTGLGMITKPLIMGIHWLVANDPRR
jgi:limonene-1,2-epoxide hydrolase